MSRIYHDEWLNLSVENTMTACDLSIGTVSGRKWLLDRGDGSAITVHNSLSTVSISLSGVSSGIKLKSLNGAFTDIAYIRNTSCTGGGFKFNLSVLAPCKLLEYVFFSSNLSKITGNISVFSNTHNLKHCYLIGANNTVTGNISVFSNTPNLTHCYFDGANNTVTGNISVFSNTPNLTLCYFYGANNTVTGDVSVFSNTPNLTLCYFNGANNTVTGDVSVFAPLDKLKYIYLNLPMSGSFTYTSTVWATRTSGGDIIYISPSAGNALSTTEVDNLLIDTSTAFTLPWTNNKLIWLAGNNAPRSSVSNSAVIVHTGNGSTVTTN